MTIYETEGEIRGSCGHRHRSIRTAVKCILRDAAWCRNQGGYTDRHVVRMDRKELSDDEEETLRIVTRNETGRE